MMESINERNSALNATLASRHESLQELHNVQRLLRKMQARGLDTYFAVLVCLFHVLFKA